jgi:hypothetical protein
VILQCAFPHVDVPGSGSAVASITPAVAAPSERVLQVGWRLFRPNPHRLLSGLRQQDGKCRRARRRQFEGEDFQQRMTIVDRPVRLVEEAGTVQKVAEARTFEAVFAPLDLGRRAAPGLPLEDPPAP